MSIYGIGQKIRLIINKRQENQNDNEYLFCVFSNYAYLICIFGNSPFIFFALYYKHYELALLIVLNTIFFVTAIFLNYKGSMKVAFYSGTCGVLVLVFAINSYFGDIGINNAIIVLVLLGYNDMIFDNKYVKNIFALIMAIFYSTTSLTHFWHESSVHGHVEGFMIFVASMLAIFIFALFAKYLFKIAGISMDKADLATKNFKVAKNIVNNTFPDYVVKMLEESQDQNLVHSVDNVTILFNDLVNFTAYTSKISPQTLVRVLNDLFSMYDNIAKELGLEKIKTIGDSYMLAGGLNDTKNYVENTLKFAIESRVQLKKFNEENNTDFKLRTGIHIGYVMAGIIGNNRLSYDIWGDTVNIASKLESHSLNGQIQVSKEFYDAIDTNKYGFQIRRNVFVKGKGIMDLYIFDSEEYLDVPSLKGYDIEQADRSKNPK